MTNPFDSRMAKKVTAKRAILSALASTGDRLTTYQLTKAGELFDVDATAIRVALGRLVKSEEVVTVERGIHEMGTKGKTLLSQVNTWRKLPSLTRRWDGTWMLIHTCHLGRTNRTQLRHRERAMQLLGFQPHVGGLWARPNNLTTKAEEIHRRLVTLGLEPDAMLATGATILGEDAERMTTLWDRESMEEGYQAARDAMADTLARRSELSLFELSSSIAYIGDASIAMLAFDPLLPDELVDTRLRNAVHKDLVAFDRFGKRTLAKYWKV